MRIHAIQTGEVRCRRRMVRGVRGPGRRAAIVTGEWTSWLPILAWAIEHDEGVVLVDTGERSRVRDAPFAQFRVRPEDHLAAGLRDAGLSTSDVRTVAFTHLHGDHMNGFPDVAKARAVVSADEWQAARSPLGRATQRIVGQPLPARLRPDTVTFDAPAVGAFAASHPLTRDGRVVMVPTPGHTPGHSSILVRLDEHDVLLAGDAVYDDQQLRDRAVDGVSPKASTARGTMDVIARHCAQRPTVLLPSHDPRSVERLTTHQTFI